MELEINAYCFGFEVWMYSFVFCFIHWGVTLCKFLFIWITDLAMGQYGVQLVALLWHSQFLSTDSQLTSASNHLQNWRRRILIFSNPALTYAWWRRCSLSDPNVVVPINTLCSCYEALVIVFYACICNHIS